MCGVPHEVGPGGLLVGEGLGAAQAGLVAVQQVSHSRAGRAVLTGQGASLGRGVGNRGGELQLELHVLTELERERG